jgi:hypothetical protein
MSPLVALKVVIENGPRFRILELTTELEGLWHLQQALHEATPESMRLRHSNENRVCI